MTVSTLERAYGGYAMIHLAAKPRFLMCPPDHFGVTYTINPWMDPASWARDDQALALASRRQWAALRRSLVGLGASIELVEPVAGLPDLVFTANAAVVLDRKVLLASFRHPERQGEEEHFAQAFRALAARGLIDSVMRLPDGLKLEGAGDCVWDDTRQLFWMGYGPRSDAAAPHAVADAFGVETVALKLADPRFYHLDTALCPLPRGELLFVPSAFTPEGLATIHALVEPRSRIEVADADAVCLAANAVAVGDTLVMPACGDELRARLAERGYRALVVPLPSFRRSGGAAFCLTLRLDRVSARAQVRRPDRRQIGSRAS
jgi:N-dimethylarginine dimethylaminohydrolase